MQVLYILADGKVDERGYRIEIAGFADTTGSAARNQTLSDQRALAVVRYLEEQHNIPITRLLLPTGMGTSHPAADNKTVAGRKMNRRVEIGLLVNQGLMAAGNTSNQVTASIPQLPPAPALDPQPDLRRTGVLAGPRPKAGRSMSIAHSP